MYSSFGLASTSLDAWLTLQLCAELLGCLAGWKFLSNFAPKDWYEATNVCANQGKVLCGVEQPCKNKGCSYNNHYQWTGEECRAGDAGLPAACASA